jgi:hypothetical protein
MDNTIDKRGSRRRRSAGCCRDGRRVPRRPNPTVHKAAFVLGGLAYSGTGSRERNDPIWNRTVSSRCVRLDLTKKQEWPGLDFFSPTTVWK